MIFAQKSAVGPGQEGTNRPSGNAEPNSNLCVWHIIVVQQEERSVARRECVERPVHGRGPLGGEELVLRVIRLRRIGDGERIAGSIFHSSMSLTVSDEVPGDGDEPRESVSRGSIRELSEAGERLLHDILGIVRVAEPRPCEPEEPRIPAVEQTVSDGSGQSASGECSGQSPDPPRSLWSRAGRWEGLCRGCAVGVDTSGGGVAGLMWGHH